MLVIELAELAYLGQLPKTVLMRVVGQLLRQRVVESVSSGLDAPFRPLARSDEHIVFDPDWRCVSSRGQNLARVGAWRACAHHSRRTELYFLLGHEAHLRFELLERLRRGS